MTHVRPFTLKVPVDTSELFEARRHDRIKIAAIDGGRVVQSHLLDLSAPSPIAIFELSRPSGALEIVIGPHDAADDDLLMSRTLRVPVPRADVEGVDITLSPIRLNALLLAWPGRGQQCRHELSLRNVGAAPEAWAVRVSAHTPATKIVSAFAPSTWTQAATFPTQVVWTPATGSPIPPGDPLPGTFAIWVARSSIAGKEVLVEWLAEDRTVICAQLLQVECGRTSDLHREQRAAGHAVVPVKLCRCLSVEASDDEDSNEVAEPDLTVELGAPAETGFQTVTVPYTIEIEPAGLYVQRQWEVTVTDEMGDEQPLIIPIVDDLNGNATFTLPDAGDYNFYLTVTDPASCVSESNRDDEENSDMDFATYRLESVATKIGIKDNVDPCDPRKYELTDATEPPGNNPLWTITDANQTVTSVTPDSSGVVHYTFPQLNVTYTVCLETAGNPKVCVDVTPVPKSTELGFDITYNSCGQQNFVVTFENLSTTASCPIEWDWDFGDGTPHDDQRDPVHTYASPGAYNVTLKLTIAGNPNLVSTYSKAINVVHWEPDIAYVVCSDGHVLYSTSVPCNWSWKLLHCQRTWEFPDGSFHHIHKHKKQVRVCYDTPGWKVAYLTARNEDGGECRAEVRFEIKVITRLCRRDKETIDVQFTYGSRDYRMRTMFKYHGAPGRIIARTKLQVRKNNKWRRKRAYEIGVRIEGTIYTKGGDGCFGGNSHNVSVTNKWTRSNRAKVKNRHLPLAGFFRVKQNDLKSTHMIRVDANDQGTTHTITLWTHDCHCS